jgi:hypothetical protein
MTIPGVRPLVLAATAILALISGAGATDVLTLQAQATYSQTEVQGHLKKVLDQRGAKYTAADLNAAAANCLARLTARGSAPQVSCGTSETSFSILLSPGTRD